MGSLGDDQTLEWRYGSKISEHIIRDSGLATLWATSSYRIVEAVAAHEPIKCSPHTFFVEVRWWCPIVMHHVRLAN